MISICLAGKSKCCIYIRYILTFWIHDSRFTIRDSRFTIRDSDFLDYIDLPGHVFLTSLASDSDSRTTWQDGLIGLTGLNGGKFIPANS